MNNLKEILDFGPAVSLSEASDLLGITQSTLRAYIHRKQLDPKYYRRSGSTWLISLDYIKDRNQKV